MLYTLCNQQSSRPNTGSTTYNENSDRSALSWITYSEQGPPTLEEIRVPTMEEMIAALEAERGAVQS